MFGPDFSLTFTGGAEEGSVADAAREGKGSGRGPTGRSGCSCRGPPPAAAAANSGRLPSHRLPASPHNHYPDFSQKETGRREGDGVNWQIQEEEDDLHKMHKGEQEGHKAVLYLQDALRRNQVRQCSDEPSAESLDFWLDVERAEQLLLTLHSPLLVIKKWRLFRWFYLQSKGFGPQAFLLYRYLPTGVKQNYSGSIAVWSF